MTDYTVKHIPVDRIYSDDEFNCRGAIAPMDVADLAEDINKNGLQFPIAVQPAEDVEGGLPEGYDFRIIAGHRRYKAWLVLAAGDKGNEEYKTIPCMMKFGLDETQARILNLGENLKRKDLDILQEAKAIMKLHQHGVPRDRVAKELGKSSGWVQTRYYLLDLPEDIQQEAAAGLINQYHIKQLRSLKTVKEQYEAVKKFKEAKARGEKPKNIVVKKKPTNSKKERGPEKVVEMIEFLGKHVGYGLHTRTLSWAAGYITTDKLFESIEEYCMQNNLDVPEFPKEF